jgi:hypothetical protein
MKLLNEVFKSVKKKATTNKNKQRKQKQKQNLPDGL